MNNNDIAIINNKLNTLINKHFIKLNNDDKQLIIKYLKLTINELFKYYYDEHFIDQLLLNDCNDIMSLFILLFPYYELNDSNKLNDLNEIFNNSTNTAKTIFASTYYIDHSQVNKEEYFENSLNLIKQTLYKINGKLLANWINIFPYTKKNYKNSKEFENFNTLFKLNSFSKFNCKIGYDTIYGVIKQFLYDDIKKIKWMIYDTYDNNVILPNIVWLCNYLDISDITTVDLNNFKQSKKYNKVLIKWEELGNQNNILKIKSLLLFYYNYKKGEINEVKEIVKNCIKNNFNTKDFDKENINEDFGEFFKTSEDQQIHCLKLLFNDKNIHFDNIYNYIFECIQQFKYTWYGNVCMNDYFYNKEEHINIETTQNYLNKFQNKNPNMTLKTFYNYFKSLVNYQKKDEFVPYSISSSWNELTDNAKEEFIKKLNSINWFSIKGNLKRLYPNKSPNEINELQNDINSKLSNSNDNNTTIPVIIFETLVFNGIFTHFVYNPINSDKNLMPNKDKDGNKWRSYIKENLFKHKENNDYVNSYNFVNNEKYNEDSLNNMINSTWYTNFGGNWICQIQQFHHFIHNRVMYVTGATGAGKSSVYPFMMLYAQKIINYNNYAIVICTEPRIGPTTGNADRINNSLGLDAKDKLEKKSVNYIQYKTSKAKIVDNYPHLTLRFTTDGSLLSELKTNYVLKDMVKYNIKDTNLYDMLLVDESHENSVNMNVILTLVKFAVYINNQITLGIISATMEYDEIIYRNYYSKIDDNYKYPLSVYNKNKMKEGILFNRYFVDKRIHMSAPFQTTNYSIEQTPFKEGDDYIEILNKYIISHPDKGNVLLFQTGKKEIMDVVKKINSNTSYGNILALPFYSELDDELKNHIQGMKVDEIKFTKDFVMNNINNYKDMKDNPEIKINGEYSRFIIVSTNVAEASITINNLSFVIDTGKQKKNIFDYDTFKSNLQVRDIALPNALQRKGRVGRTKNGFYFTTYDFETLNEKILYPITTEEIINNIVDLITTTNTRFIDKTNDPYLVSNIEKLLPFIKNQYVYNNISGEELFNFEPKILINDGDIIYPYNDGGFDMEQLKDEECKFYIVSPNEDLIIRDDKTQIIISKKDNYKNRINIIFDYLKKLKLLNDKTEITPFGSGVLEIKKLFVDKDENSGMEIINIISILHCNSFILHNAKKQKYLIHNMILMIINEKNELRLKTIKRNDVKCDFIFKSKNIKTELYFDLNCNNFNHKVNQSLEELIDKNNINEIDNKIDNYTYSKVEELKLQNEELKQYYINILRNYNKMKIKFQYVFCNLDKYNINNSNFDTSKYYLEKYDLFSYITIYYYSKQLLKKLNNVPLYIKYYDQDLTDVYMIMKPHKNLITDVSIIYLHNFIFYIPTMKNPTETNEITNIMYIPENVVKLFEERKVIKYNKNNLVNSDENYYLKLKDKNSDFEPYANIILQYN